MAGDKFNIKVSSWYKTNGSSPGTPASPLTELLATLINGVSGASGGKATATELTNSGVFTPSVTDFLTNRSYATSKPKAYLNWILFDEQFKLVSTGSGAEQVGDDQEFKVHVKTNLPITKNGYLYVYESNETPNIPVYFDNLQVTHTRGPLLEETHYYPFGLTMSGISSKSAGSLTNKYKYNGKELQHQEFSDGSGLETYDYGARMQDPQLGRWWQVDKLSEKYPFASNYAYVLNRPTVAVDPDGKRVYFIGGAGNDQDGWDYINRWARAFSQAGINDFYRVNATKGSNADIIFTASYRNTGYEQVMSSPNMNNYVGALSPSMNVTNEQRPVQNDMIDATVSMYQDQLKNNPLKEGEQFNLVGYSYGSVLQAQSALKLAHSGQVIDNLVLIGSPISDKSDLMKQLQANKNIKNVIRYDLKGDLLSNPKDILQFIQGGYESSKLGEGDNAHHFDGARPGNQADHLMQTIVKWLQQQGVKN